MKKVTIHDVAREAGVSAATVSYIINNREDQSISEETKQKVWHVINMLNYKPSIFAKSLRSSPESKLIAVCVDSSNEISRAEFFSVMQELESAIDSNYSLVFSSTPFKRFSNADCIVAVGFSKDDFHKIGKVNFIPLIAVDSFIDDKLFFQVTTDLSLLKEDIVKKFGNDYTFVAITPSDKVFCEKIKSVFENVSFVNSYKQIDRLQPSNVVTTSSVIATCFKAKGIDVFMPEGLHRRKFAQVATCITQALSHESFDVHSYEV